MFGKKKWIVLPVLALLIGFLGSVLAKNEALDLDGALDAGVLELDSRVKRLIADNDVLTKRVGELTQELLDFEGMRFSGEEMAKHLQQQLDTVRIQAGLTAVTGSGVQITAKDKLGEGVSLVTDEDLLSIVNELNASGAEAISINGERLVATSEIRKAGDFVSINARHYAAPFEILAVGNPQTLYGAMYLYGGVMDRLSKWIDVEVQMLETIEVPAFVGQG